MQIVDQLPEGCVWLTALETEQWETVPGVFQVRRGGTDEDPWTDLARPLNSAEQFFYDNAGWSHDPETETLEEAKIRNARQLAQAEEWAGVHGLTYVWVDDWSVNHLNEFDYDEDPLTCEFVEIITEAGDVLASLGCIDDADYRRVIAAELALEANGNYYTTAS
jgi:hypothetical protein